MSSTAAVIESLKKEIDRLTKENSALKVSSSGTPPLPLSVDIRSSELPAWYKSLKDQSNFVSVRF
jgi:hypothetical protein